MYDVIIVGARCAGAPLAMLLARGGARVLVVDRTTFPSDIPHGHFIHRQGPARLKAWGLLDRVAAKCTPIAEQLSDVGDFPLVARNLAIDGVAWGYGPRRAALDAIFVDAAIEAGAEVRQAFTVDEFLVDGDRITGSADARKAGRQLRSTRPSRSARTAVIRSSRKPSVRQSTTRRRRSSATTFRTGAASRRCRSSCITARTPAA